MCGFSFLGGFFVYKHAFSLCSMKYLQVDWHTMLPELFFHVQKYQATDKIKLNQHCVLIASPAGEKRLLYSLFFFLNNDLQHVGDDPEAPHVCIERYKIVVDDLWSKKLRSTKIHSKLLPGFISVVCKKCYINDNLHCCASNRSNKFKSNINTTHTLARPKSMILILFVTLLTQRIFSG